MKIGRVSSLLHVLGGLLLAFTAGAAKSNGANPIEKIIGLLTRLQGQLVQDGESEAKAYGDYTKYCNDASFSKKEEITAASSEKDMLVATIAKAASDVKTAEGNIEDGSAGVAENEAKLKAATQMRAKEEATFQAAEKEIMGGIDMLGRAIDILTKEMAKGGAALLQSSAATQQLENVIMGLGAVIDGASLGSSEDLKKLTAMVQMSQDAEDSSDDQDGAAQKPYEQKSGGTIEVLEDLRDKAETQLRDIRTGESKAIQNFDLTSQAIKDETAQYTKELDAEKIAKSEGEKAKATAEGSLATTTKELAKAKTDYSTIQSDCMQKAADHESTVAGRQQELKVLATAKKLVQGQMAGAAALIQKPDDEDEVFSFVQMASKMSAKTRLAKVKIAGQQVVALVQRLAEQESSDSLKQLASRISAVMKYGVKNNARDPFVKVKNLLGDMIRKLTREQESDASEKEYCDKEMKKTKSNQDELNDDTEDLKAKIDQAAAASTKLKTQVKDLQWELGNLEKLTQDASTARREAHEAFMVDKGDLSKGLNAVRAGIHVLRDYYGATKDEEESFLQTDSEDSDSESESDTDADSDTDGQPKPPENFKKSGGAGGGIIEMLEVVESNLAKNLAELQTEEDDAQSGFQKEMQQAKVSKAVKDADVSNKVKEYTSLDKNIAELSSDAATVAEELSAVNEYFAKVKDRCVAKPVSYADRKARREKEIKGLEEAKSVLESEGSFFLQRRSKE